MHSGDKTHCNKLGGLIEAALIASALQNMELNISYAVQAPAQVLGETTGEETVFTVNGSGILTAYDIASNYTERAFYWEGIGQSMLDEISETAEKLADQGSEDPDEWVNPFTDVKSDRFEEAILWAYYNGITTGTGDGTTFSPENACTRKQIVTFLWRAAGEPEPKSMVNPFTDVKSDRFEKAILWAYYEGITTGTGDGTTFSPEDTCTRKQIVTFLWRYHGEPARESTEINFTDVKNDRFAAAILWAADQGITTGTGDGSTFSPEEPCTRKQIVTFLYRDMNREATE